MSSRIYLMCTVLCLLLPVMLTASVPYFHRVEAKPGDSVNKLLSRYHLDSYTCNAQQFIKINNLTNTANIRAGQNYFIPVYIYEYNGKSIRSSIGIDDWDKAIRIKTYNEVLKQENLRQKDIVNSKVVWVPYHELNCMGSKIKIDDQLIMAKTVETSYKNPDNISFASKGNNGVETGTATGRDFNIFGNNYKNVPLKSSALAGKVFYLVGGHGGPDPGAMEKHNGKDLCEDEYAYDVTLRLARLLLQHGATAYMVTRDDNDGIRDQKYLACDCDERYWGSETTMPLKQIARLRHRSAVVNALYDKNRKSGISDQYLVAIHIDSRSRAAQTDMFFYYYPGSVGGKKLAQSLYGTIKDKYAKYQPGRVYTGTVSERNLHMLRETKSKNVYIELGNLKNAHDQNRILIPENRQAVAEWLFEGFLNAK